MESKDRMTTLERYNMPVKIFYANLLKMGIKLRVKNGELRISGNKELATPTLQAEIVKRAEMLVDMLTPPPSPELASHFERLLTLAELKQALTTAEFLREKIDCWPVDGGWLLTTGTGDRKP